MIKRLIAGFAIGIANIIPGVSGGTMMVILGVFQQVMDSIARVLKKENPHRAKDIWFLCQILIGAGIGVVGFSKLLEILFEQFPTQTMFWFLGLVVFSIPMFLRKELKRNHIQWGYVIVAMLLIFIINMWNPGKEDLAVNPALPPISLMLCINMLGVGFIGGFSMLLPGVSGSMMLLIFGQYYLFKTYLASVTSFQMDVLVPLAIMGIGVLSGIAVSAKITALALRKNKDATLSFILGLILASSIVLIPIQVTYTLSLGITSAIAFLFGGAILALLNKMVS
ncbi:MAG: DUF368 domain-containing protein [Erysipelotrichaceae bacterium]|nr:DUF368 domain-containing protein [Erysipelotrichaceae bacterium]